MERLRVPDLPRVLDRALRIRLRPAVIAAGEPDQAPEAVDRTGLVEARARFRLSEDRFGTRKRVVPLTCQIAVPHRGPGLDETHERLLTEVAGQLERDLLGRSGPPDLAVEEVEGLPVVVPAQQIRDEVAP